MFSFNNLPLEVIVKIYNYLDVKDIKSAQRSCHQWLSASQFREIENRMVLRITDFTKPIRDMFKSSFRKFPNVHVIFLNSNNFVNEGDLVEFFSVKILSDNIQYLVLENLGSIYISALCKILEHLPKLLKLIFITTCFEKKNVPIKEMELLNFSENISSIISPEIKALSFHGNYSTYINLKLFSRVRNLKTLDIQLNNLDYNSNASLYQIIKHNEKSLQNIYLKLNKENNLFLKSLLLLSSLNLNKFILTYNSKWSDMNKFFKRQSLLRSLTLSSCELNDTDFIKILKNSPLIENLDISNCRKLTRITILEIAKIKYLTHLNINETSCFHGVVLKDLVKNKNNNLTELKCMNVRSSDDTFFQITQNLPSLQIFHCGSRTLSDVALQHIIGKSKNLTELNLFGSDQITDYGLTGISLNTKEKTGYPISKLTKLTNLNLRKCPKVTDQTLLNGLKFKNLKVLFLPACFPYFSKLPWLKIRKVSLKGFNVFTKNCPTISELNLLGCSGTENLDKAIKIIIKNLKELQRMTIARHCERVLISQEAYLVKRRKDLSRIKINCKCEVCFNIKTLCENFI